MEKIKMRSEQIVRELIQNRIHEKIYQPLQRIDSLRKLALAFEISPIELFAERRQRTDNIDKNVSMPEQSDVELKIQVVPVVGEVPSNPSPYNNQLMQITTGYKDVFVLVLNSTSNLDNSRLFRLSYFLNLL